MATLTVNNALEGDGLDLTLASAAGGGDLYEWSNSTLLYVQNDDASPTTITITPTTASHKNNNVGTTAKATIAHAVAANSVAIIDTRSSAFRNSSNQVSVTYSSVTSLSVAAIKYVSI